VSRHPFALGPFGVLGLAMSLSALGGSARATTRYVSLDGRNEYPYTTPEDAASTIQSAVDAAEEGDDVLVGPGVYREHVILKEGVNLSGSARNEVTIYGVTPVKPVLTLTWDNAVEGFTIQGSPCAGVGIYAELGVPPAKTGSFKPFRISDCWILWCGGPGILVFARQEPSDVLLRPDPRFASPEEWERYLEAIYDTELEVEVSGCHIGQCDGSGIVVHIQDLSGKYEGHFFSEPWGGPYGGPIELGFKHATLRVSESSIGHCRDDGISVRAGWRDRAQVIVDRSKIYYSGRYGIHVTSGGATGNGAVVRMNNCLLFGNQEAGVWSFSIDDGSWGMMCVEPSAHGSVFAQSSTIARNSVGILGSPFSPGAACGLSSDINLKNCIVFGNADSDIDFTPFHEHLDYWARGTSHSCVGSKELAGIRGNIDSDPLFADPQMADYRLLAESPCIDTGGMYLQPTLVVQDGASVISWEPGKDLDGNPRIAGNGPDMGAYEAAADPPNYLLESSEDLVNWTEEYFGPATTWTDPRAGSLGIQFYRVSVAR
jgi:hypothetical protein